MKTTLELVAEVMKNNPRPWCRSDEQQSQTLRQSDENQSETLVPK
jgi:hypothetical protein